jgi:uncharacterized protein (UPF0254 family)
MSERLTRLTDDDLQVIDALSDGRDGIGASRPTTRMMLAELKERRAADISSGDIDQIMLAIAVIRETRENVTDNEFRARLHIVDDVLMRIAENAYKQTALYRAALDAVGMKP